MQGNQITEIMAELASRSIVIIPVRVITKLVKIIIKLDRTVLRLVRGVDILLMIGAMTVLFWSNGLSYLFSF